MPLPPLKKIKMPLPATTSLARQRPRRVFGGPRERGISAAANADAGTEQHLDINK
jgi:hypothetical protein